MKKTRLSIVTPTFNNHDVIEKFLDLIAQQTYVKHIEVNVCDGGSTDQTVQLAKKYPFVKIFHNKERLAEPGISLGMEKSTGDLIMILAVDNYLYDPHDLENMVKVFSNSEIYAAFPKHMSQSGYSIFSQYVNTFTDPFNHFVYWNAANARTFEKVYPVLKKNTSYTVFDFLAHQSLPMIAFAQGFTIRADYSRDSNDSLDDVLPVQKLIQDKKTLAYAHSINLYHDTIRNWNHFYRKQKWATKNALEQKDYGIDKRKNILSLDQQLRMKAWPIYALSIVFPSLVGIIMFIRTQEKLWLIHPFMCFLSALASVKAFALMVLQDKREISRQ